MENDRTDALHLFGFVKIIRNPKNYAWHLIEKWSRSEVGQKSQDLESAQNGFAYSGKS